MTRSVVATVVFLVLNARVAAAAGPATTRAADPDVAALVVQLDADDWQARDAAAAKLVAKGDAVRPVMADAAAHAASPEVRSRAAGVIAKLDQLAAERPTRVTLHYANANPRDAFAGLAKQAGVPIRIWPDYLWTGRFGATPKVTIDFTDKPFWPAMDELCKQAGARPQRMGNGEELTIMEGSGQSPLAGRQSAAGRFTIVAKSYQRQRSVDYADGQTNGNDSISFVALLDPKVRLASSSPSFVQLAAATDDKGNSMVPDAGTSPEQINGGGGPMAEFQVEVRPAGAGATKVATLRGTLKAAVIVKSERMVIDDLGHAGPVTRVVGPYTVELKQAKVTDREVSYTLVVQTPGGGRGEMSHRDFRLEDAAGQPISGSGGTSSTGMNGQRTFESHLMTSEAIHGPVRLVWDVTTQTKVLTVPFEFHDLPLPPP